MSKATEEFKQLMESNRGEKSYYENASPTDTIKVPITREGFEALLTKACAFMELPVTNPLRNVLVGFLHHIENNKCHTTIEAVGASLHKAMSNQCTWEIDQEIKKIANEELREEQANLRAAQEAEQREMKLKLAEEKRTVKSAKKNGKYTTGSANSNEKRV